MLELQASLTGAIGHGLHSAVILVTGTVEDDLGDAGCLRLFGNRLADSECAFRLRAVHAFVADGHQRTLCHIVDDLCIDVLEGAEHHETRTLRGATHCLAHAEVTALAPLM